MTVCQESRVNSFEESGIKDYFQIVLDQGFAGARKAKTATVRHCAGYMDTLNPVGHQKPGFSLVDQMTPDTPTHWVRGCVVVPCPLDARGQGVAHWVRVAVVPGGRWCEGRG